MANIETQKNIETCRGEDVLAEVSALPQDPHFGSLVNEALDPLKQQALHQAGYDGYSEVIEQHKPYTFASAIIQMKSNLLLLLRTLWQFHFGSGTLRSLSDDASLRSLADMWSHYITRLSGNETYGIPSRLSSLTDLPSAPLLVADRKISGVPEAVDGMTMARVLCDKNLEVTELTDDNYGYEFTNAKIAACLAANPKVKKFTCNGTGELADGAFNGNNVIESIHMPNATRLHRYSNKLAAIMNCGNLKEILLEGCTNAVGDDSDYPCIYNCAKLQKVVFGKVTGFISVFRGTMPDIIHVEFAQGVDVSLNFQANYGATWNPTNALDASLDTLVTDEDCHNNLEQFLKNFRTYIALRLATFDSNGPTLTLSQAVYDAIKDESHLFVFDEGTMTIYAYLTNIKHWTVTK